MEVLLKRSILDECARLSGVNKGPQFIAAYSKARKDVYERLSSQEKKQLEDLIVRWNHDGPPPLVQQKYVPHCLIFTAISHWWNLG